MISDDKELMLDWIGALCWFKRGSWRISEYVRIHWMLGLQQGVLLGWRVCGVSCRRSGKRMLDSKRGVLSGSALWRVS
jgi:hypothetical protein